MLTVLRHIFCGEVPWTSHQPRAYDMGFVDPKDYSVIAEEYRTLEGHPPTYEVVEVGLRVP